jgi:Mg2+ and Co2+ transporter CorA
VLEAVQKKLEPEVSALLVKAYEKLSKESVSIGVQEAAGFMAGIIEFVKNIFSPAINKIDGTVGEIEGMLGMNESAIQFVFGLGKRLSERRRTLAEEYQGYKNYETFLVTLALDNDRGMYDEIREFIKELKEASPESVKNEDPINSYSDLEVKLADKIKEYVEEIVETGIDAMPKGGQYPFIPDLVNAALAEVDWREIARTEIAD